MILVLSNGHGEDLIGSMVVREARALRPSLDVAAFPLVGTGKAYRDAGIEVVGVQRPMPSGGFAKHGVALLARDVMAGLLALTLGQVSHIRRLRPRVEVVVCVGDAYPVLLAGVFARRPVVCLSTAKSEYIRGHHRAEKWLMRRVCRLVFARDERTARELAGSGINAAYAGNVMMDAFSITGENFGLSLERKVVGILPGSREEAYRNMARILEAVELLAVMTGNSLDFVVALAPSLDVHALAQAILPAGWRYVPGTEDVLRSGVVGRLERGREGVAGPGSDAQGQARVLVTQRMFGDVLNVSSVVIGLSGTGNEQAAGLGRPVVAFPGRGPQFTARFARAQKRLLGEALALVESGGAEAVAREVLAILGDPARVSTMRRAGYERMGEQGAARRTAKILLDQIDAARREG